MKLNIRIASFLLTSILFTSFNSLAQIDSILFESGIAGYNYTYQGEKINGTQVLEIIENNTTAYEQFKSANEASVFANIFAVTGILLIALPAGMELTNYEANWSMAWAGSGLIVVSIPLFYKRNKNIPLAIDAYNNYSSPIKDESRLELNFGSNKNGVGLCLKF